MKLVFLYYPVNNLKESLAFYRDTLGFEETWREGEHTVGLKIPGSDVQIMIEDYEAGSTAGGIFGVDSVDDFYNENKDVLEFVKTPVDVPPGRYAVYKDNSGNLLRILDFTNQ
ncbi:VOC family protein [Ornithinibacillus contaminans]|uniref:VOC family protein n=1 Tax=Ornithinibacillus contaminans TaxID=694055 RepID=UPI00064E0B96|nr:VOC family protein [Ornithinibacillus contaminans]